MPNISDRIGNQNVIRVLSNIGASATRLVDLSDVDVSSLADGFVLEYKAQTSKFITTDSFRFVKNINVTGILTTYNLDVIAFKDEYPEEFKKIFTVDVVKHCQQAFYDYLKDLFSTLGWSIDSSQYDSNCNLTDFFNS